MARIYDNLTQLVGKTPLMRLSRFSASRGLETPLLAKLEYFNPLGSVKDRVALNMVEAAEQRGLLGPGSVVIEPTSGNTGIGLAFVCACRGYRIILTMPETMSAERVGLLRALGAEVVLTEGAKGMKGSIEKAEQLAAEIPNSLIPQQFSNPANPQAHERTTALELLEDTDGDIGLFVACFGTGGTISGVAKVLKREIPGVQVVGIEPADSPLVSKGTAAPHKIQGIGANFVPSTLDLSLIDRVETITTQDAYAACRQVAKEEGLLVGISAGAALHVASRLAAEEAYAGRQTIVLLPDGGERYLSAGLY